MDRGRGSIIMGTNSLAPNWSGKQLGLEPRKTVIKNTMWRENSLQIRSGYHICAVPMAVSDIPVINVRSKVGLVANQYLTLSI